MGRRKGELSAAGIDSAWPHRWCYRPAATNGAAATKKYMNSALLTLCSRGHSLYHDGQWFHAYCFREHADAQKFLERFGGEKFAPAERGRGANWARWRKR